MGSLISSQEDLIVDKKPVSNSEKHISNNIAYKLPMYSFFSNIPRAPK
jgi:hypothetical protein